MRPLLSACSALAVVLAMAACQPRGEVPAVGGPPPAPSAAAAEPERQARIPERPDMAPEGVPISETPCRDQIGEAAAARLVQRCIQVSPATRPPCNAANPCDLIQGEIERACKLWDKDPPAECRP